MGLSVCLALLVSIGLFGCGAPSSKCLLSDDRIGEAYLYGMNYLENEEAMLGAGAFKSILACNKGFSPAYSGLAISYAQIAAAGINPNDKTILASLVAIKMARKYSSGKEDDFIRHIAAMRARNIYKSPGWFMVVQNEYRLAMKTRVEPRKLPYYGGSDAAAFFMGRAYFDAGHIESAMAEYEALSKADRKGKWGKLSEKAFKRSALILSHIETSEAGSDVVVLVFHRDITREDLAAILVGELRLDERLGIREIGIGMREKMTPVPGDITKSPFRGKILKVIRLGIKGLEPTYSPKSSSYFFNPHKMVSRKDFAIIMDDILKKLSSLTPVFVDESGPYDEGVYSDVPAGEPWHNAVMAVTRSNLMSPLRGTFFGPDEVLDGPDAFSAVLALKRILEQR